MSFESLAPRLPGASGFARILHSAARFHWRHAKWLPGKWRIQKWTLACLDDQLLEPVARLNGRLSLRIDPEDYLQRFVFATGTWEEETTRLTQALLRPGDSFVDVGAHVGYFSLIAADCLGGSGYVHAFEPIPQSFSLLERNVRDNRLEGVIMNNTACWSVETELTLHQAAASNSGKSSVIAQNAESDGGERVASHRVQAVTLDRYVEGLEGERVALIKADVEGCEGDVLNGAWKCIEHHRPMIILEVIPRLLSARGLPAEELVEMIRERSYACRLLDWNGTADFENGFGNAVFIPKEKSLSHDAERLLQRQPEAP